MPKLTFIKNNLFLHILYFILVLLTTGLLFTACSSNEFTVSLVNESELIREHKVIRLNLDSLKQNHPDFNFSSFVINDDGNNLQYEIIDDAISSEKVLCVLIDFSQNESKEIIFKPSSGNNISVDDRTKAYLGKKENYEKVDGVYSGGEFISIDSAQVPPDHFAHDALYQFEGPGWESEKVGYRLYLDDRNRTDIFW
jgi:hypothetical protein